MRKFLFFALIATILAGGIIALSPVEAANACLPCYCFDDPIQPINCYGKFSVFAIPRKDVPGYDIQILTLDKRGNGREVIYVTAEELAELPEHPEEHMLIAQWKDIALYKLTYGDYQVNVGPDEYNAVHVLIFRKGDAFRLVETGFQAGPRPEEQPQQGQ